MTIFPFALTNQNTERHTPGIGEYPPVPCHLPTEGVPMSFFSLFLASLECRALGVKRLAGRLSS
jgi:hypothetical protein